MQLELDAPRLPDALRAFRLGRWLELGQQFELGTPRRKRRKVKPKQLELELTTPRPE